jgi:hypothetical protein
MSDDVAVLEGCDKELSAMLESFANMLKAAKIPDEEAEQARPCPNLLQHAILERPCSQSLLECYFMQALGKERRDRAPGDLLEVWAEKLVNSAHTALHLVSQLKRGALLSDFEALIRSVRSMRTAFAQEENQVALELGNLRQDAQGLLAELEASYYPVEGPPPQQPSQAIVDLEQLIKMA